MTPRSGSPHHSGDGCVGDERLLARGEREEITTQVPYLLAEITAAHWDEACEYGDLIARHYGPQGEWVLTCALANRVTGQTPTPPGDAPAPPLLGSAVPPRDPGALSLLGALAARRNISATSRAHAQSLDAARVPLQLFMQAHHAHLTDVAWRHWSAIFTGPYLSPSPGALAFTALLVTWAARCPETPPYRVRAVS